MRLRVGTWSGDEEDVQPAAMATAMRAGTAVATAPPPPPAFYWAYQDARTAGAAAVLSIHLSGRMSPTCQAARAAASQARLPVYVVDSGSCGMALGFAVLAAAEAAQAGANLDQALGVARRRLAGSTQLMYVDTLEYLRRGGRIGAARTWLGTTLGIKPVLTVRDGEVAPFERLRGTDRALARMSEVARQRAGRLRVDLAVEHFDNAGRAVTLAERLRGQIPGLRWCYVTQYSMAIGAHTGPGALGVALSPC
jgi:DegV family protein with EDD domain